MMHPVVPAKAGTSSKLPQRLPPEIPACAGMTRTA
jgi:hypothetical protein